MIQVCYSNHHIGDRKFGEKEPLEDRRETHGLCDACFALEIKEIEKALKEYRTAKADAILSQLSNYGTVK